VSLYRPQYAFSKEALPSISQKACNNLLDFCEVLCLVARVRREGRELFVCDPQLIAGKPDCFLFNPKSVECSALYYQDQVLLAHFFGFVRNVGEGER